MNALVVVPDSSSMGQWACGKGCLWLELSQRTGSLMVSRSSVQTNFSSGEFGLEQKLQTALKERRTDDAWQLHQVLRRDGVLASQVCLSRLVAQLSLKGTPSSLSRAQKMLVDLQTMNKVELLDADSLGLLVMASARAGAGRYALSILRLMLLMGLCPPVKVWSAVVSRLGRHPCDASLALDLFDEICSFLKLDQTTDSSSCGSRKENDKRDIEETASSIKQTRLDSTYKERTVYPRGKDVKPDTGAFNAVLNACATLGLVEQANHLVERMVLFEVGPDLFTFNILIKLFGKAGEGDQLAEIMEQMDELGIEPDLSTYNSLMSSYVSLGELDEAQRLVRSMQQGPDPPENTKFDAIECSLQSDEDNSMSGKLQSLEKLMKRNESGQEVAKVKNNRNQLKPLWRCKVKPDVRTYTTLMKGYVKKGRMGDAVQLLIAMQNQDDSRSRPNEVTYTTVIAACVDMGLMDEARSVLVEMVAQNVPANLVTYNILLKGYCNVGQLAMAYELIDDMRKAGLSADVVSYNTLIYGCIQRDDNVGALEVFREMRRAGIAPSEVSYTTLMNAFARNGQPKLVHEVFKEMQTDSWMRVDVIAWNVLIDGYCRAGLMVEAKQVFTKMKEEGFLPNVATYGSLAKGFGAAGQPGEVLVLWKEIQERTLAKKGDQIEPLEPDGGLLDCLVDTCLRAGFFQKALEVVACMEGQGILADKTKYKRMFIELYSSLYTSRSVSPRRLVKSAERRSAVEAFKFWLGLPNDYYQQDWAP